MRLLNGIDKTHGDFKSLFRQSEERAFQLDLARARRIPEKNWALIQAKAKADAKQFKKDIQEPFPSYVSRERIKATLKGTFEYRAEKGMKKLVKVLDDQPKDYAKKAVKRLAKKKQWPEIDRYGRKLPHNKSLNHWFRAMRIMKNVGEPLTLFALFATVPSAAAAWSIVSQVVGVSGAAVGMTVDLTDMILSGELSKKMRREQNRYSIKFFEAIHSRIADKLKLSVFKNTSDAIAAGATAQKKRDCIKKTGLQIQQICTDHYEMLKASDKALNGMSDYEIDAHLRNALIALKLTYDRPNTIHKKINDEIGIENPGISAGDLTVARSEKVHSLSREDVKHYRDLCDAGNVLSMLGKIRTTGPRTCNEDQTSFDAILDPFLLKFDEYANSDSTNTHELMRLMKEFSYCLDLLYAKQVRILSRYDHKKESDIYGLNIRDHIEKLDELEKIRIAFNSRAALEAIDLKYLKGSETRKTAAFFGVSTINTALELGFGFGLEFVSNNLLNELVSTVDGTFLGHAASTFDDWVGDKAVFAGKDPRQAKEFMLNQVMTKRFDVRKGKEDRMMASFMDLVVNSTSG